MKKVLLALLLVGLMAMPAAASVQNVKVSGDIESTFVVRDQFDLGSQTATNAYYQNFLLTQTRLRVDADLTDNVQATVGLINERVWGADDDEVNTNGTPIDQGSNDVDLNLAYVTLKEMLYSPLTVVVGRQNFAFGNSFVMDSAGSNNSVSTGGLKGVAEDLTKRTALDAVRLILDYNPLTINIIGAKVDAGNVSGETTDDDDIDLFGTNVAYQLGDKWQSMIEGYFWAKIDQSTKSGGAGGLKADTVYMPGVHVGTNPIKGLNLSGELALQSGNDSRASDNTSAINLKREAMAAQFIANYLIPVSTNLEKYKPGIMAAYTYVSGDDDPNETGLGNTGASNDQRMNAWDPMFENQAGGTIYNSIFNLSNAHILTAKASVAPIQDVTAWAQLDNLWLAEEVSGGTILLQQPDGSTLGVSSTTDKYLGNEIGLGVNYAYTEDVNIGAKAGWFSPGDAFSSNNSNSASQILVNANVNF